MQTALFQTFRGLPWYDESQTLERVECAGCGHSIIERPVVLSPSMIAFLGPLFRAKKPVNQRELVGQISNVTYSSGHYLHGWGLIKSHAANGRHGPWSITPEGEAFIHGAHAVPVRCIIAERRLIRFEGAPVRIFDRLSHMEYEDYHRAYLTRRSDDHSV